MQSIIFPLQTSDLPALANLQDALQLFLDRVSSSMSCRSGMRDRMTNPSPNYLNSHSQIQLRPSAIAGQNAHAQSQTQTQTGAIDRHRCKPRPLKKMIKQPNSG
jgi:hypothetical protein